MEKRKKIVTKLVTEIKAEQRHLFSMCEENYEFHLKPLSVLYEHMSVCHFVYKYVCVCVFFYSLNKKSHSNTKSVS